MADETHNETDKSRTQRLRAQQAEEGKRAMAEYLANAAAVRGNIERQRALRLEREAAAAKAVPLPAAAGTPPAAAGSKAPKRVKKPKAPAT